MSYHILHLLSPNLRVRLKLEQLHITDTEKGTERTVPIGDVAVIIAVTQDVTITSGALRKMAERNVLLLVCNEKFEPCSLTLPYYRATDTELLRRQIEWTPEWKEGMWRQLVTAKIRNQMANLSDLKRARQVLEQIAARCENKASEGSQTKISVATLTPAKRAAYLSHSPSACESCAARHYWKHLMKRLAQRQGTEENHRVQGTREGINGMLDYGYAILRTAVLRSLAAHGFIAAIGLSHAPKAGSFALADDLVEPLRPWIDQELRDFVEEGSRTMNAWMQQAVCVLQKEVRMRGMKIRLLHAIDLYVQSLANATLARAPLALKIPMIL